MSEIAPNKAAASAEGLNDLNNCFNMILNRKKLVVKRDGVEAIMKNDLSIDTAKLNSRLASVLADSLVMYMRMWPGWQKSVLYFTGKLMLEEWFEQFRQYLMYKMNFIITNEKHYLDLLKPDDFDDNNKEVGVQTLPKTGKKEMSPYSLVIHGTASMLNNFIFMQRGGEFRFLFRFFM